MDYRERWELKDYLIGQTLARRILLFNVCLALTLLTFLVNFWYLQGVHGEEYADLAENNRLRMIPMLPMRGEITDRRQTVIAATRPSLTLVLLREGAHDVDAQLARVAPILSTTREELASRLERMKRRPLFEPLVLKEDVKLEELARVEVRRELFPSIEVQQAPRRTYPYDDVFAHVLGYVGEVSESQLTGQAGDVQLQLGDIVGKSGIERNLDASLRGARGWRVVSVNNLGRRMEEARVGREPQHGEPLSLTIDAEMQTALRQGLVGETGAGVFLDPWTGEVLALYSAPAFHPNLFADGITREAWKAISEDPERPLQDRAIASAYAPGSTFKVLMAIAGLESGVVSPSNTVYCGGSTTIYGHQRLCWKKGGHGTVDLRRALTHSCNVYFYHLGQRLGIEPITRYAEKFNLGRPTGVDLPGETEGILPSAEWKLRQMREPWYPGDTISVAIGQGLLAVTPIQMATMISAVATRGALPRPHLVREHQTEPVSVGVSPETFRIVHQALRDAVELGTGRRADLEGIGVAGKTGTAQVFKHSAGIDADKLPKDERDHAWFVGYAPYDRPRIAFAVVVEHGGHGGTTAAPVVRQVLEVFFGEEQQQPEESGLRASADRTQGRSDVQPAAAR